MPDYQHLSFAEIDLSTQSLCPGDTSARCYQELIQLQHQVAEAYPILIPQPNVPAPLSADEATTLYRKYVADHAGEPVLIAFKQLYPRILLTKYGILASNDHTLIRYFTEHMLEAHSQDFATLTRSLTLLKAHVPPARFNQWLENTIGEAAAYETRQYALSARIRQALAKSAVNEQTNVIGNDTLTRKKKMAFFANKWALETLEKSTISADLAQLRRLRTSELQGTASTTNGAQ